MFCLIQECPYNVIRICHKKNEKDSYPGFAGCDKDGVAFWLPYDKMNFLIQDEETEWMFRGETFREDGNLFAIVSCRE